MPLDCGYRCTDGWDVGMGPEYGNYIESRDPYCPIHGRGECPVVEVTLSFRRQLPPSLWGKDVDDAVALYKSDLLDTSDREFFDNEIATHTLLVEVEEVYY